MHVIETPIFTRRIEKAMTAEEYRQLQVALGANPELGTPIGAGLRKVRWGVEGGGKRGGARVIYYWAREDRTILMLFVFLKNEQGTLTPDQTRALRKLAEEEYP
jgi:hypothetical protein